MPLIRQRCAVSVLALSLAAPSAFADVTAADVWADWKSTMADAGYTISAVENQSGGMLTVSDLKMAVPLPDDAEGTVTIEMDRIGFSDRGDGAVDVQLAPETRILLKARPADDDNADILVTVTQADPVLVVSGAPENLAYSYTTPQMVVRLADLSVEGVQIGPDIAKFEMAVANLASDTQVQAGDLRTYSQTMTSGAVSYDIFFNDPEGDGSVKIQGAADALTFTGGGTFAPMDPTQDVSAMIEAGMNFDGTFGFGAGGYEMSFDGPDGSGTINTQSQGATLAVGLGEAGLRYNVTQAGMALNMVLSEIPLPISLNIGSSNFAISLPVQKAAEAQPFGFALALNDFTMSDAIWGLFDPNSQLPRDPATIALDVSGMAKLLFDVLDPMQATALEESGAAPGELEALDINGLTVAAAGAELTGTGAFTFDNSDTQTFDGMPRPAGALDLALSGGNGLIDKLVGMGLLPEEQAMGARMMLGLFAVPGEGEDQLTSRIEINADGHILANGQRIQ